MSTAIPMRRAAPTDETLGRDDGNSTRIDYSDEVTLQQMARIEVELESLDMDSWEVVDGPAW